jgi:DNA-binding transcriptional MerR regulator
MDPPSRTRRDPSILGTPQRSQAFLTGEELAAIASISVARLERLVQIGVLEPDVPGTREFTAASAARLRRMLRLHAELHVNFAGAAIIVDLLERLERLEIELDRMRAHGEHRP